MARRDKYHDVVKQGLQAEGWVITHDPYMFRTDPRLAADLGAERLLAAERGIEKIAVEIKSFLNASQVVDLESAVGQYSLYKLLLQRQEPERLLYLAVSDYAYSDILSREVGQLAITGLKLNLMCIR
ncbi:element excision factor XisH family protein [Thiothrix eikelboomii]|uniref:element excision factor XisH family protein n=1 Tax=Thiothrix eikelboomii TaxID=92487 RepID=UPI003BAE7994